MAKWETVRIGDICEVVTGGTPSTNVKEYWDNGTIPWLPSGVCQNSIIDKADTFITQEGLDNSAAKMMPIDTVVIALTGATTGKVGILKLEACANQSVTGILPNDKLYYKYLFFYLLSARNRILDDSYGGAQKHISQGYVKDFRIPLPSLETQRKIAANLDKVTHTIDLCNAILEKLDLLVKSRFVEMFGDPEADTFTYETKKLKELSIKISDGVHAKPAYTESGRPFLSVVNINRKKVDFTDCKYVSEEAYQKMIKSTHPEKGDVLYTKVGATYGIPAYVDTNIEFCLYVSVCLIKPKHELINSKFLAIQMDMPFVKHQADRRIKGIGVPDLHLNQISEFDIICPPRELQDSFVAFVEQTDKSKLAVKQVLEKAETLKKALMQEYFG